MMVNGSSTGGWQRDRGVRGERRTGGHSSGTTGRDAGSMIKSVRCMLYNGGVMGNEAVN